MKAWHVQDRDGEYQEIVFADKRSEAIYKSEASTWTEYIHVRAKRAKYCDGLENESEEVLLKIMLDNGWWFECHKCFASVTEEDKYFIENKNVFCEECGEVAE